MEQDRKHRVKPTHLWAPCVCVCVCANAQLPSHAQLFATPWTVACQTPLSMGFSRQEYWSGCHFLLPHHLGSPKMSLTQLISRCQNSAYSGRSRTESACLFHLPAYRPFLMALYHSNLCFSCRHMSLSLTLLPSSFKDPCDYTKSTQIISSFQHP